MTSRLDALAATAWWTAAARACESRRPDRLFNDPWAAVLVGLEGLREYDRAIAAGGSGIQDLHSVGTRFFDDFLLHVTHTGAVRQVVLVAAGLDTRAFRLPWPSRTRVFELDQPQVIAYKDSRLSLVGTAADCERRTVGVDLTEPWTDALVGAGFDPSRGSVWILEGFLYFLAEPVVIDLLSAISDLTSHDCRLGLDAVNGSMLTDPSTRAWNDRTAAIGAPWLFTVDDPQALLDRFGWSAHVVQPGGIGADYGRYPVPVTNRAETEVPRSFLVTATRR